MNRSEIFLEYHSLLHSVALKILRCKADAEDAVHDAFEKWMSVERQKVNNVRSYLVSTVRNISLNKVKRLAFRSTESLEELSDTEQKMMISSDDGRVEMENDLQRAVNIILHKLEPLERLVIVLREVLNLEYDALTKVVGKKAENCRQILCRAKRKLKELPSNSVLKTEGKEEEKFVHCLKSGSFRELIKLLKSELN